MHFERICPFFIKAGNFIFYKSIYGVFRIVMFKFRDHKVGLILGLKYSKVAGRFLFVSKLQAYENINNK